MRTLLIDNYDSFTYNLFHLLCEVNGREPEVVRNDDPHWRPGHLAAFDNIVLSPGPGHPARPADFGICHDALTRGGLPVLGVCLGHQGMAAAEGAEVVRAPRPCHGETTTVEHSGTGLFEGLPVPFQAVRYHSLTVGELPGALEATAWTPDGLLMGLQHRELPWWGVQFHPESVDSHCGLRLLSNFRTLTERRPRDAGEGKPRPGARSGTPQTGSPLTRLRPAPPAADPPDSAPARKLRVLVREMTTRWHDEAAFTYVFHRSPHAYWLDSSRSGDELGRFSVMGDASGPLGRIATADVSNHTVTVTSAGSTRIYAGPFLDWLDEDLARADTEVPPLPCDFALGWVGCLGYELKAECGGDLVHRAEDPDAVMVFSDRAIVLDHRTGITYVMTLTEAGADPGAAERWLDETQRRLERSTGEPAAEAVTLAPVTGPLRARHSRQEYLDLISACRREISAGESYEICLTNMLEADWAPDPWNAYQALRRTSPAPFGAFLRFGELSVLSSSPERFLRVGPDRGPGEVRIAESRPIKGTRPRRSSPVHDAALAEDLRTSVKDHAENLMIVDLVRNDLGRCAQPCGVEASEAFRVESYATVHQLVSTVRAHLRDDVTAVACTRAAFPGGSMTGAPKKRTMEIIDRLEGGPRGIYSGALGYFSLNGAADLSIVIRTAVLARGKVRYGVGGAVIALSDPDDEYEETIVKAAPLLKITGARFPAGADDLEEASFLPDGASSMPA